MNPIIVCPDCGQRFDPTIDAPDGRIAWPRAHFPEQYAQLIAEFPRLAQLR